MRIRGLQMCVETLHFDAKESVNILYLTTGLYVTIGAGKDKARDYRAEREVSFTVTTK